MGFSGQTASVGFGLLLVVVGYALRAWAYREIQDAGIDDLAGTWKPNYWTTEGPYQWTRHPMYVGSVLVIAGVGIVFLGWGGAVLFVPSVPYFVERALLEDKLRNEPSSGLERC